jgi:hypothetical protein
MNKKDFVIICFRLLGIYILITGISFLPSLLSFFIESSFSQGYIIASPIIYIATGGALYFLAPRLCSLIIDFSEAEEEHIRISANEKVARIALLVLGVYIFTHALPQLIHLGIDAGISYQRMEGVSRTVQWYEPKWLYMIPPFVQLVIAGFLIVGSDKVIEFISQFDDTFKRIKESKKANSGYS